MPSSIISRIPPVTAIIINPPPEPVHLPVLEHLPGSSLDFNTTSRRKAALFLSSMVAPFLCSLVQPRLAFAFSLGISGPKEWLKEQKKKSAKFVLAPVDASRNILRSVSLALSLMETESKLGEKDLDEVQRLLISAARDCVRQDRNPFVVFQANTGVEVCTFQLIVKNATSLLADNDPFKVEAEAKLGDLIRSFTLLNGMARGEVQLISNRQRVVDAIKDTISSLNNFEQSIKDCLEV